MIAVMQRATHPFLIKVVALKIQWQIKTCMYESS
jgi:hypothetical protein